MSAEGKQRFLDAVAAGKGFLAFHSACASWRTPGEKVANSDKVDPYIAMLGAEFIAHGPQQEAIMRGNWAALALRIDRRRVNRALLRAHIELELDARRKAALDAGRSARIGRDERRDLREDMHNELLKKTSPTVDSYPLLVHTKRRVAHVLALGKGVNDLMRVHFLDTFGIELLPLTPWRLSAELLAGSPLEDSLEDLHRTDFARGTSAPALDRGAQAMEVRQ